MSIPDRVCIDRILPQDLERLATARDRAAIWGSKRWPNGSTIRFRFIGGTDAQRALVQATAAEWTRYANLTFSWVGDVESDVRVSFNRGYASSYIGTDCRFLPQDGSTMNIGWDDDPAMILHEVGHGIGLAHEHSSPASTIQWNEAVVIAELGGPPNFWSPEMVRHNVLRRYGPEVTSSEFDRTSVMMYSFPARWTLNGVSMPWNGALSATDKAYIGGPQGYPRPVTPEPPVYPEIIVRTSGLTGQISRPGEEDLFTFRVAVAGRYVVQTTGQTDTFLKLWGPVAGALTVMPPLIAEDDNAGQSENARIARYLLPGQYLVQVRHASSAGTGRYGIRVRA